MSKVSIVGAGNVGASLALYLVTRDVADVVLIDVMDGVAAGKALDIFQSGSITGHSRSLTGGSDYALTANSDIVVITAGVPRKPGMTREHLLKINAQIMKSAAEGAMKYSPNAIFIVVTNPLDVMTQLAHEIIKAPGNRVIGMAGVLDSARFQTFIADELKVSPEDVRAMVLGGHGDLMVPLPRHSSVNGVPLNELVSADRIKALCERTRDGGAEIVKLLQTGSAFYSPAASVTLMVEAILKDKKRLVAASVLPNGEYGLKDVFVGLPVILGRDGVEKIVDVKLDETELAALTRSADSIRENVRLMHEVLTQPDPVPAAASAVKNLVAQPATAAPEKAKAFSPGLEGVIACATRLSHVDGDNGRLIFAGHNAVELATTKSIEEVWFLLHEGRLPSADELASFKDKVRELGVLTRDEVRLAKQLRGGEPLADFRSIISAIAAKRGIKPWLNRDVAQVEAEIMALSALAPAIVEVAYKGKKPLAKRGDSGYAERYLWGLIGHKPKAAHVKALETYLILTMDHGLNASTFNGRVCASTGADVGAALTAAVGTLSGPLHGGAPGPVLDMLDAIGSPANARNWVETELSAGRRIMGFGHRVYRTDDPRALALRAVAEQQAGPRITLARVAEQEILCVLATKQAAKAQRLGTQTRPLRTNVEFWTAVVLEHVGIPRELYSSTFATSRIIGWGEHIREQLKDNKLFRPLSVYSGPAVEGW